MRHFFIWFCFLKWDCKGWMDFITRGFYIQKYFYCTSLRMLTFKKLWEPDLIWGIIFDFSFLITFFFLYSFYLSLFFFFFLFGSYCKPAISSLYCTFLIFVLLSWTPELFAILHGYDSIPVKFRVGQLCFCVRFSNFSRKT